MLNDGRLLPLCSSYRASPTQPAQNSPFQGSHRPSRSGRGSGFFCPCLWTLARRRQQGAGPAHRETCVIRAIAVTSTRFAGHCSVVGLTAVPPFPDREPARQDIALFARVTQTTDTPGPRAQCASDALPAECGVATSDNRRRKSEQAREVKTRALFPNCGRADDTIASIRTKTERRVIL